MSAPRDPLKDAEARVRALTREVGSLREDLRRETKRRERAVCQSQEAEAARSSTEHKVHELTYANRKLAAELEAAQDGAKAASERDRRALRTLREGLAEVEEAVARRAERGSLQVASAFSHINTLRALLLGYGLPGSEPVLPSSLANTVTHTMTDMIRALSAISALLTNAPDAEDQAAAAASAAGCGTSGLLDESGAKQHPAWPSVKEAGAALLAGTKLDLEKEGLRDEVHRLRTKLRTLMDEQSGTANATALALQFQLRSHVEAAEAAQAELLSQIRQRDAAVESLQAQLQHDNHVKGAEAEKVHAELLAKLHEQTLEADGLRARLEVLQGSLADAEAVCEEGTTTAEALGNEAQAQAARAEEAEAAQRALQVQLREQADEAEALRAEVKELHHALQAMGHEGKALRAELECMQERVHTTQTAEASGAAAAAELRLEHAAAMDQVQELHQKVSQLQLSESAAKQEVESLQALVAEREAQLAALQATITAQNADMTRALSLVTQGHAHPSIRPSLAGPRLAAASPPPPAPPSRPTHYHTSLHSSPSHPPAFFAKHLPSGHHMQSPPPPQQQQLQQRHAQPAPVVHGVHASSPGAADAGCAMAGPAGRASLCQSHGGAGPLSLQQELQQLLQLQEERRRAMLPRPLAPPLPFAAAAPVAAAAASVLPSQPPPPAAGPALHTDSSGSLSSQSSGNKENTPVVGSQLLTSFATRPHSKPALVPDPPQAPAPLLKRNSLPRRLCREAGIHGPAQLHALVDQLRSSRAAGTQHAAISRHQSGALLQASGGDGSSLEATGGAARHGADAVQGCSSGGRGEGGFGSTTSSASSDDSKSPAASARATSLAAAVSALGHTRAHGQGADSALQPGGAGSHAFSRQPCKDSLHHPTASQDHPQSSDSFSFGEGRTVYGTGDDCVESQQKQALQQHMTTLDLEIEALGASIMAAARNVGVTAS